MNSLFHSLVSYVERYKHVIAVTVAAVLILAIFVPFQNRATTAAPLPDASFPKPPHHDNDSKPSHTTVTKVINHIINICSAVATAVASAAGGGGASAAAAASASCGHA